MSPFNRYKIPSNRMPGRDYSGHGIYFITLCVEGRECIFGCIDKKKMMLNYYGQIAAEEWMKSQAMRREIELDVFVIMPNHVHGIVVLHPTFIGNMGNENDDGVLGHGRMHGRETHGEGTHGHVETHGRASLRANGNDHTNDRRANDHGRTDINERANDNEHVDDNEHGNGNEHADDPGHAKSNTPVPDNNDHSNHPRSHRKPKSLSSFIAGYKSPVTTRINNYIDS